MRSTDWLDGPLLKARYENGQVHFIGTQDLDEQGHWIREGTWEAWHENGQLMAVGAFHEGLRDGVWKWWAEDGKVLGVGQYNLGERVGSWTR